MNDNPLTVTELVGHRKVSDDPEPDDGEIHLSEEQKARAFALTLARPLLSSSTIASTTAPPVDSLIKAAEWIMSGGVIEYRYPFEQGDVTVLGPEIFATDDGRVICWKGENYTIQEEDHYGIE